MKFDKTLIENELKIIKFSNQKKYINFLYQLLKSRKKIINISHNKTPSYFEHRTFCKKMVYRMWFIIEYKNVLYGSFYLTKQNNISINLIKKNQNVYRRVINFIIKNIKPLPSIPSVRPGMFTVNFSVKNKDYVNIVQQIGGVKVQETYILNANR